MVGALTWFNVALRGVMEAGIVAALAYWGYHTGQSTAAKVLLGIGAPLLVFGFWGLVDFRQAGRIAEPLRLVQELVVCGVAVVALAVAGQPALAWALGVIAVVQHALVYALGERLLKE
jgi:predicted membrane protein